MAVRSRYAALMHEVCVDLGWCGGIVNDKPRHVDDYIPPAGPVTAAQFVDWLMEAEGFTSPSHPEDCKTWRTRLRAVFIRHMGSDIVDASELRWEED